MDEWVKFVGVLPKLLTRGKHKQTYTSLPHFELRVVSCTVTYKSGFNILNH